MIKKRLISLTLLIYLFSSTSCGVILYPERQGQTGGKVDPAVALFDAVGLLLFIVPGLIAFAIDFHQGTIYLPNSRAAIDAGGDEYQAVKVNGPMTIESIEAALEQELGFPINIEDERAYVMRLDSIEEMAIPAMAFYSATRTL